MKRTVFRGLAVLMIVAGMALSGCGGSSSSSGSTPASPSGTVEGNAK